MATAAGVPLSTDPVLVTFLFEGDRKTHNIIRFVSKEGGDPQITATFCPSSETFNHPLCLQIQSAITTIGELVTLPKKSLAGLEVVICNRQGNLESIPVHVDPAQIGSLKRFDYKDRGKKGDSVTYQFTISVNPRGEFQGRVTKLVGARLREAQKKGLETRTLFKEMMNPRFSLPDEGSCSKPLEDFQGLSAQQLLDRLEELKKEQAQMTAEPITPENVLERKRRHDRLMEQFRRCSAQLEIQLKKLEKSTKPGKG